jgi:hypothetical protein
MEFLVAQSVSPFLWHFEFVFCPGFKLGLNKDLAQIILALNKYLAQNKSGICLNHIGSFMGLNPTIYVTFNQYKNAYMGWIMIYGD